jgi:predicted ABC-type transport system involved in lysophospholipase L1 biosynthesis ATPase subunit
MSDLPLIHMEGVRRHFDGGRIVALDGIDLSIGPDECIALVGKSGSGKSCLLNMATGLDLPDEGRVRWMNRPITEPAQWARLRLTSIGIVFQEFHLLPTLSAQQNVELALMGGGANPSEQVHMAQAILDRVGLASRYHSLPSKLSGGERQRVAIARALVREPAILFADEPTGNLDSASAENVADLLFELHRERSMALVLVTHDESLAKRCARLVRLSDGRIVEDRPAGGKSAL